MAFPIRCTGGTSQFNSFGLSNVNSATPNVSGQFVFEFDLTVFRFFAEANLSIVTKPRGGSRTNMSVQQI